MKSLISGLIIIIIALISIKISYSTPNILFDLRFDGQSNILWKYAASIGVIPYKEIFYPYGLLNYFLYVSPFVNYIYALIVFALLFFLYTSLDKLFKKSYSFLVFAITLFTIYFLSGFTAFARYGICAVGILHFSIYLYHKKVDKKILFVYGILAGLLIFLITDQGILFPTLITTLYFASVFQRPVGTADLLRSVNLYKWFIFGVIIAAVPFVVIYSNLNMLGNFISNFLNTVDISTYAKTPYFHSLKEPYGVISFGILYISVIYIAYSILFVKQKSITFFPILGLVLCVVLFDQKSIIRYLGYQISFIFPVLGGLLMYECVKNYYKKADSYIYWFSITLLIGFFVIILSKPLPNFTEFINFNSKNILVTKSHKNVIEELNTYKDFNGKLFTFSSDPVFYIMSGQHPPYYLTTYEMSPLYAQKNIVDYIESNNISYLIYNSNLPSVQDGVPDYVRVSYLYSYIFSNYIPVKKIDNFIILKKDKKDFFALSLPKYLLELRQSLLRIDLGSIPSSEGYHKIKRFTFNPILTIIKSSDKLNVMTQNVVVIVYKKIVSNDPLKIIFHTKQGITEVSFSSCKGILVCIVNLSRVPLFYRSRIITGFEFDSRSIEKVQFVKNESDSELW